MNQFTGADSVFPTFLISSSAAQEFIALQSAEIARLRADIDQLRDQVRGIASHNIGTDRL